MGRRQTQPTAAAAPVMDSALLAEAIMQGKDPQQVMAEMQKSLLRQQAVATHGVATVRLSKNMQIKQSARTGRWYALGQLQSAEGIKVQGGRELTPERLAKLGKIEVDLGMTEGCSLQVEAYREQNGLQVATMFEFQLGGEAEITRLNARFPKDHEDADENIYLIDPNGSETDASNWTAEENDSPLYKYQLRFTALGYLGAEAATIEAIDLPDNDDDFDAFLTNAGKVSATLQAKGLDVWRKGQQELNTASEDAIQAEMQKMAEAEKVEA